MTQTTEAVSISVLVPLEPGAAFELFIDRFTDWWPKDSHHIADADAADVFLEPREGGEWNYDPDPAKATEVEVTFIAEEDGTRVTLEHRGFDVHGEAGAGMRESVSSEGGWQQLLQLYRDAA